MMMLILQYNLTRVQVELVQTGKLRSDPDWTVVVVKTGSWGPSANPRRLQTSDKKQVDFHVTS